MVVEARELPATAQGYGSDAEDLLPLDDALAMPDGGDEAALSDTGVDATAASGNADDPTDDTDATWQAREQELTAQHNQQLSELRSIKDRESASWQTIAASTETKYRDALGIMRQYVADVREGKKDPDHRDLIEIQQLLDGRQQQTLRQRSQEVQTGDQWVQRQVAGHQAKLAELSTDEQGRQLFKPEDLARDPAVQQALAAHIQSGGTQETWDAYNWTLANKRAVAMVAAATGQKAKTQAAANRAKAQGRGVQNTAARGGAAAVTLDGLREQANKANPNDPNAAYTAYLALKQQHIYNKR